jgi:hypothetical protein
MLLHQRRKEIAGGVVRWKWPAKPPTWMDAIGLALLPQFINVRIVGYAEMRMEYRTRQLLIATTLVDSLALFLIRVIMYLSQLIAVPHSGHIPLKLSVRL